MTSFSHEFRHTLTHVTSVPVQMEGLKQGDFLEGSRGPALQETSLSIILAALMCRLRTGSEEEDLVGLSSDDVTGPSAA